MQTHKVMDRGRVNMVLLRYVPTHYALSIKMSHLTCHDDLRCSIQMNWSK